jgi:hypothetical protein
MDWLELIDVEPKCHQLTWKIKNSSSEIYVVEKTH